MKALHLTGQPARTHATEGKVLRELRRWRDVRDQLEAMEIDVDEALLLDTMEGETDLKEALLDIADVIGDRKAMSTGLASRISDLQARKQRLDDGTERLRAVITSAMDKAGAKKIANDAVTLSLRETPPNPVIETEADIPSDYWEPQPPKLDKQRLAEALNSGTKVPGARLSNGGISLTMRVK